jgi:hypothetical protein
MVFITHIRMSNNGTRHEHITDVKWRDASTRNADQSSIAEMVAWIENRRGVAKVTDGVNTVNVGVVNVPPKHLRTFADGRWTDNLLALPRF